MDRKSKTASWVLALLLGTMGAHRYYLGYTKQGILQTCGWVSLILGYSMSPAVLDGGAAVSFLSSIFMLYGIAIGIWAFVDFIRILTGGLQPANGMGYREDFPTVVQVASTPAAAEWPNATAQPVAAAPAQKKEIDSLEALEKLAKLHEQGILTDEEFQQQKEKLLKNL